MITKANDRNSKIFLTGSKGFIGSQVANKLKASNFSVTYGKIVESDKGIMINESLDLKEYDCICHIGASSKRSNNYSDIIEKNIIHTENIFYNASKHKNIKVVFISANSVVGTSSQNVINFNSSPLPKEIYSVSKFLGEEILLNYVDRSNASIIRLPAVYGIESNRQGLLDRFIELSMNNEKIIISNENSLFNNAAIIDDVVDFIVKSIVDIKEFCGHDFILGSSNSMSIMDIVLRIKNKIRSSSDIVTETSKKQAKELLHYNG